MGRKFPTGEAIRFGWNTMKDNIGFFVALLVVAFLIKGLPQGIGKLFMKDSPFIAFLFFLTSWIVGFVVNMGFIKVSLKFCDGIKGKLDDLLSSFDLLINFIASSILYGLIVIAGLIFFIIPGIILAIKFFFYSYFIIDKRMGPVEALKASSEATKGFKMDLLLFGMLIGLINLAGFLCLVVGLIATIPTSMVAYAYVYRVLSGPTTSPASSGPSETGNPLYVNMG